MLGDILLAVWTAACIAMGSLIGAKKARQMPESREDSDAEKFRRIRAELDAEMPDEMKTQWENMMKSDGTGRGQKEIER